LRSIAAFVSSSRRRLRRSDFGFNLDFGAGAERLEPPAIDPRRWRPGPAGGAGHRRRPHHLGSAGPKGPGGGGQRGAGGGDVVHQQHPGPEPHSGSHGEHRAPAPLARRPAGLRLPAPADEAGLDRHGQGPAHRPGEMLGLVKAPLPAPGGGGRGPGDHVDRAGGRHPQPVDESGGQHREGRPGVAVLHPGQGLSHRPLVGEGRRPPVEPGRRAAVGGAGRGGPGPAQAGRAEGGRPRPAAHAAGGEGDVEQRTEDLHAADPTEGVWRSRLDVW